MSAQSIARRCSLAIGIADAIQQREHKTSTQKARRTLDRPAIRGKPSWSVCWRVCLCRYL